MGFAFEKSVQREFISEEGVDWHFKYKQKF